MKRHLLSILLVSLFWNVQAYDFSSDNAGKTLYYTITSTVEPYTAEVAHSSSYSGDISIPSTVIYNEITYDVTNIGNYAFQLCTGLTSIIIPNSVKSIGSYAFYNCTGLTSITIPNSVTSIGGEAFNNTAWYNNQPNGLIIINSVLYKYKGICPSNITIPYSVTNIGENAFSFCSLLTSITISNSVTSIGTGAFWGCTGLTSITIPNSVTSIGVGAFSNCIGLTNITIPNSVISIGGRAFNHSAWYENQPDGLIIINNIVIDYKGICPANIIIPNSVKSIGSLAFYYFIGLTSITIPNSVTSIGDGAFYDCTSLTSISIPGSIQNMGDTILKNCDNLIEMYIWPINPPSIRPRTFEGVDKGVAVTVLENSLDLYENSLYWSEFYNYNTVSAMYIFVDTVNTADVPIETTGTWTVESDVAWLIITPDTGTGNDTFVITAMPNTTGATRTGTVTVNSTASVLLRSETTKTIVITQEASNATEIKQVKPVQSNVTVVNGSLQIINPNNEKVVIYNMQGKIVQNSNNLPKGVYIVKVGSNLIKIKL